MKKGQEQLRVLMGGRGGNGAGRGSGGDGGGGPGISRGTVVLGLVAVLALWLYASFYTVKPEEKSVELFLGECYEPCIGEPGLNFAPWPLVKYEVLEVTREQVIEIGEQPAATELDLRRNKNSDTGLMLTGDENIVDVDFQVVWNITSPDKYLFNLADPALTIDAVAESAMREIIAQSELAPILNRDRGIIAEKLKDLTQSTLDSYDSGVNIVRINLNAAEPPSTKVTVKDIDGKERETSPLAAYRDVQDAEQERDQLKSQADAYSNRVLANARGRAAQVVENAEGYRARVVNQAEGDASRFLAVLEEYKKAPDVTRERLYLEMIEDVFSKSDVILLEDGKGASSAVPYLPLNEVRRPAAVGGSN
ncbi:FtsH protease activity modulator HflK [Aquicoccus sp. G2-2]|uniref:FtsH protease activity modulator HflK n=1 Tax=Aquicoccus sp. G2-2 TaxID=3092120 RepID=UPI002ADF7046|nr:FtsH protease activity modulator HflK [Aquicoccus sp. G2-2]MEA1114345.1 FtsH protease activity modulator HflK [Aquicoccus sp. G2-2]